MNSNLNYITLYLFMTTLFSLSSAYFYWLISQNIALKKQQAKYVSLFFIFMSLALLTSTIREFGYTPLSIILSCSCYVLAVFCFRQTLLLRQTNIPIVTLCKNKWLYANIVVVVILLNVGLCYFIYDSLIARILIILLDCCLILYTALYKGFWHSNQFSVADKILIFFVLVTPLINVVMALIIYALDIMQWYFILLLVAQILQIFLWTMAFAIILMSDVMDVHYQNSISDSLTGLFNRGYFTEYISQHTNCDSLFVNSNSIHIANPSADNYEHGLLFIDIDFFKKINDNYGHSAGDLVIAHVAKIIQEHEKNSIVARFGGEEFAVFLEHKNRLQTLHVANTIRHIVEDTVIDYDDTQIKVTVSIGVANIDQTISIDHALKIADAGLYKAKQTGRNKVCYA